METLPHCTHGDASSNDHDGRDSYRKPSADGCGSPTAIFLLVEGLCHGLFARARNLWTSLSTRFWRICSFWFPLASFLELCSPS